MAQKKLRLASKIREHLDAITPLTDAARLLESGTAIAADVSIPATKIVTELGRVGSAVAMQMMEIMDRRYSTETLMNGGLALAAFLLIPHFRTCPEYADHFGLGNVLSVVRKAGEKFGIVIAGSSVDKYLRYLLSGSLTQLHAGDPVAPVLGEVEDFWLDIRTCGESQDREMDNLAELAMILTTATASQTAVERPLSMMGRTDDPRTGKSSGDYLGALAFLRCNVDVWMKQTRTSARPSASDSDP